MEAPATTSENRSILGRFYPSGVPEGESRGSNVDLSKGRFIIFARGGEMAASMRVLAWSAMVLGPMLSASLAARRCNADAPLMPIELEKETDT